VPVKQIFAIITVCLFYCVGCTPPPPNTPVWENVKFKDLARTKHPSQSGNTFDSPLQFTVYIFSVPADNFSTAKDAWTTLAAKPIRFVEEDLFRKNGFAAGVGQTATWESVAEKLRAAGSKNQKTTDLIMFDANFNRLSLLRIDAEKSIFYRAPNNQISGVTLEPGEAMLRFSAATIPDMRGACKLTVEPVFKNNAKTDSISADTEELVFSAVSFTATMSQGDFVLLGSVNYANRDMTLSGIFFSSQDRPTAQIYLIVCTGVNN
jgi:hypothetical protein